MIWEDLKDCEDIENKKDLKDNYMTNDFKMTINAVGIMSPLSFGEGPGVRSIV